MRIVLQRVKEASVQVNEKIVGQIGPGLVLLVGIQHGDTEADARYLADKCVNLRIFEDNAGKMNISALEIKAEMLAVSQFTLYADSRKGRRPSFVEAAPPEESEPLFNHFVQMLKTSGLKVETGIFGAHMLVKILNDGPVTIILDS
ncbi:D-tyrosyl-tRNA(Tyr) deacylase [candidate division KSB1 bacterium]|nr:D-tyrosyl-tRNA(Tyr) deacylase [bacterium]RKY84061.1 MAG: D-tyrosyl-tRNA(Tyr) deacylase [candidate division KSB1 bacterium]RKY85169.1 MAG: D-tyrosyl-tRNA(Tyr) deacylase [candidate division KSB1 bacterium]